MISGLTEEQAYLTLQRQSRQKRRSMKEVAEAIVLSEEVKNSSKAASPHVAQNYLGSTVSSSTDSEMVWCRLAQWLTNRLWNRARVERALFCRCLFLRIGGWRPFGGHSRLVDASAASGLTLLSHFWSAVTGRAQQRHQPAHGRRPHSTIATNRNRQLHHGQTCNRCQRKSYISDFLAGDKLLLMVHGEVVAGIDFSHLKPGDVRGMEK